MAKLNSDSVATSTLAPRNIGLIVSFVTLMAIYFYENFFSPMRITSKHVYNSLGAPMSPALVRHATALLETCIFISALVLFSFYLGRHAGVRGAVVLLVLLSALIIYTAPVTDPAIAGANVVALYLPCFPFLYIGPVLVGLGAGKLVERILCRRRNDERQ